MEEKNFICTACPMGCKLIVRMEGSEVIKVAGNRCRRGDTYGRQEAVAPQRMVASTVRVSGGLHPLLPVYTKGSIPKRRIADVLAAIRAVEISAPAADRYAPIAAAKCMRSATNRPARSSASSPSITLSRP